MIPKKIHYIFPRSARACKPDKSHIGKSSSGLTGLKVAMSLEEIGVIVVPSLYTVLPCGPRPCVSAARCPWYSRSSQCRFSELLCQTPDARVVQVVMKLEARDETRADRRGVKVGTQAQIRPVLSSRIEKVKLIPAHQGRSYVNWLYVDICNTQGQLSPC